MYNKYNSIWIVSCMISTTVIGIVTCIISTTLVIRIDFTCTISSTCEVIIVLSPSTTILFG